MHITNIISQKFGKFASKEFPKPFQALINFSYVKFLGLDMSDFKKPCAYKSLNELFTRELLKPREIEEDEKMVISPTDSYISACGKLQKDTALQIKGMEYNVEELLTFYAKDNFERVIDGEYMNFYLSPKDYHRYHAPDSFKISKLIHVPGKLYPVNFKYLNKEIGLFVQNERVILECFDENGKLFYMVFVGALNVGQMVFDFEPRVETNKDVSEIKCYEYDDLYVKKGDCLGYFKMGSTVVMFWEKDSVDIENLTDQKIIFTQKIATKR